jgi:ABC-type amino acid transport substrate-binding protein
MPICGGGPHDWARAVDFAILCCSCWSLHPYAVIIAAHDSSCSLTESVTVGVKSGTTGATFVAERTAAQSAVFPEAAPALQALADGQVDAVVVDIPVIAEYIKTQPAAGIKLTGGPVTEEACGIAVSKAKPELLQLLNDALRQVQVDGAYDRIFQKWFAAP